MNLHEQLLKQSNFSNMEKTIAAYITMHIEQTLDMSIQQLAKQTYVSTTSIIRLCKKLGMQGFQDFKIKYSRDVQTYFHKDIDIDVNHPLKQKDTLYEISQKMSSLTKETIDSCQKNIDYKILKTVVDELLHAEQILAIGVSDSFIRIIDLQAKLLKINIFVKTTQLQPDQVFLCTNAKQKDIALLVSYSGKTAEVVNAAKILKQKKVKIIGITADENSPIAKLATYFIQLPNKEITTIATYSFFSQIAIEYVLNVIYCGIYNVNLKANEEHLHLSRKQYLHF